MKMSRVIITVSVLLILISLWLPAITKYGVNVSFMDVPKLFGLSMAIVVVAIIVFGVALIDKKAFNIIGIILGAILSIFSLMFLSIGLSEGGVAFGAFVLFLGCIGCILGHILKLIERRKSKQERI